MNMNTCNTNNDSGWAGGFQGIAGREIEPDYFDGRGGLLICHYPFVYEQVGGVAKRLGKDVSWLDPAAGLEERKAAVKANGWGIGAMYSRCSTTMQDSGTSGFRRDGVIRKT
jgi:hypothetical protein